MTLHQTLYRKLTVLIPTSPQVPEYAKFQVSGFMDLNLDLLSRNGEIITVARSESTRHVAVEGGVADRHLAFVAGGQDQSPRLVGDGHEDHAPAAGLEVLLGRVRCPPGEHLVETRVQGDHSRFDGDDVVRDTQGVGLCLSVPHVMAAVYREGMRTASTSAGPRASTAMHRASAESMPPASPSTAPRKPFFAT